MSNFQSISIALDSFSSALINYYSPIHNLSSGIESVVLSIQRSVELNSDFLRSINTTMKQVFDNYLIIQEVIRSNIGQLMEAHRIFSERIKEMIDSLSIEDCDATNTSWIDTVSDCKVICPNLSVSTQINAPPGNNHDSQIEKDIFIKKTVIILATLTIATGIVVLLANLQTANDLYIGVVSKNPVIVNLLSLGLAFCDLPSLRKSLTKRLKNWITF